MKHQDDRLLTPEEVCAWFRIKKSALYRLTCEGRIPHIKLGNLLRFRKPQLERWLLDLENGNRSAGAVRK